MIHGGHDIPNFEASEFSEDPHEYAHPSLLWKLQRQRDVIQAPIYPSPVPGALARFEEGAKYSMHYNEYGRGSCASDWFTDSDPFRAWNLIISSKLWRGMGIYFDTKYRDVPWIMFHTDYGRVHTVYWFRYAGVYTDSKVNKNFWQLLFDRFKEWYK
jgi:hypothetical protein